MVQGFTSRQEVGIIPNTVVNKSFKSIISLCLTFNFLINVSLLVNRNLLNSIITEQVSTIFKSHLPDAAKGLKGSKSPASWGLDVKAI